VYFALEAGWARNWNSESSPVGTFPPVQVTFWITALSPEPVCCRTRCHPGLGTNESIPKPCGTVSTIFVVVRLLFSVGTARLYNCSAFDSETAGLTRACADAAETNTSAASPANAGANRRRHQRGRSGDGADDLGAPSEQDRLRMMLLRFGRNAWAAPGRLQVCVLWRYRLRAVSVVAPPKVGGPRPAWPLASAAIRGG